MSKKELEAFAKQAALNAKLDELLGYARHEQSNQNDSRNGYSSKTRDQYYLTTSLFIAPYFCHCAVSSYQAHH